MTSLSSPRVISKQYHRGNDSKYTDNGRFVGARIGWVDSSDSSITRSSLGPKRGLRKLSREEKRQLYGKRPDLNPSASITTFESNEPSERRYQNFKSMRSWGSRDSRDSRGSIDSRDSSVSSNSSSSTNRNSTISVRAFLENFLATASSDDEDCSSEEEMDESLNSEEAQNYHRSKSIDPFMVLKKLASCNSDSTTSDMSSLIAKSANSTIRRSANSIGRSANSALKWANESQVCQAGNHKEKRPIRETRRKMPGERKKKSAPPIHSIGSVGSSTTSSSGMSAITINSNDYQQVSQRMDDMSPLQRKKSLQPNGSKMSSRGKVTRNETSNPKPLIIRQRTSCALSKNESLKRKGSHDSRSQSSMGRPSRPTLLPRTNSSDSKHSLRSQRSLPIMIKKNGRISSCGNHKSNMREDDPSSLRHCHSLSPRRSSTKLTSGESRNDENDPTAFHANIQSIERKHKAKKERFVC